MSCWADLYLPYFDWLDFEEVNEQENYPRSRQGIVIEENFEQEHRED